MRLSDESRIGVIGGGPAGALTSYFLLEMADRVGLKLIVDIYEPKDFSRLGPAGCNNCGGVVSESLVQMLATDGINLPPGVVQRSIDGYVLHTDQGIADIRTPLEEMRIACVHRGSGPSGSCPGKWSSFDDYLLRLACDRGAVHKQVRVREIRRPGDHPVIRGHGHVEQAYELVIGAVGVAAGGLRLFNKLGFGFQAPKTAKACISELHLGAERIQEWLGHSMHVFLLDMPGLEFAAIIPKGDFATVCILGRDVDQRTMHQFMTTQEVRECLPIEWDAKTPACKCGPRINVAGARHCFADRIVLVGDCGVSRLYKDGIGAAYRAAKACAVTAVFHGVSAADFSRFYWPTCKRLERDNRIGKLIFWGGGLCRKRRTLRRAVLRIVRNEQRLSGKRRAMSRVLWDTFTGSAPYGDVFSRVLRPGFLARFLLNYTKSLKPIPSCATH